jgi:hypothetical protein
LAAALWRGSFFLLLSGKFFSGKSFSGKGEGAAALAGGSGAGCSAAAGSTAGGAIGVMAGAVAVTTPALGCRADCHFINSAPPSAPAATNNPICNGFMLQFSVLDWTN